MKTTEQQNKDFEEALGALVDREMQHRNFNIIEGYFLEMSKDDLEMMRGIIPALWKVSSYPDE